MPVRLVIRNFPPHVDAENASAFVAQATARGAPVRCETLYYRRGKEELSYTGVIEYELYARTTTTARRTQMKIMQAGTT